MNPQNISEIRFTINEAEARYRDSLIFENGLLVQNWKTRYDRKTQDMEAVATLKGVPYLSIRKYVDTRMKLSPKRKDEYEKRLNDSVPAKVQAYITNLKAGFGL